MKKTICTTVAALLSMPSILWAGSLKEEEILRKIEALQQLVIEQQERIEALESKLGETDLFEAETKKQKTPAVVLSSHIDHLKIKGDFLIRYGRREHDEPNGPQDNRDRLRSRLRVGAFWQNSEENWEIGLGFGGSFSTWSNDDYFGKDELKVYLAYVSHRWREFIFTAGQQPNPFTWSWLFWEGNIRPIGFTAQYGKDNGLYATLGTYAARYYVSDISTNEADTAMLSIGQLGYKGEINQMQYNVAASCQIHDGVLEKNYLPATVSPDYEFNIGDIFAMVSVPIAEAKIGIYGQVWKNFGAEGTVGQGVLAGNLDPEEENVGWILGLENKINKFKMGYSYASIEADSLFGELKDQDFGDGLSNTDIKGHRISFSYNMKPNWSAGIHGMLYEALERKNEEEVNLYFVDMKYYF